MRAWRALPAFRGDSSARTWLLAIARRACADQVRRAVRRRRLAAPARAATATLRRREHGRPERRPRAAGARRRARPTTSAPRSCSRRWSAARTRRRRRSAACPSARSGRAWRAPASASSTQVRAAGDRMSAHAARRTRRAGRRGARRAASVVRRRATGERARARRPRAHATTSRSPAAVTPARPRPHVHVVDLGDKLELTNDDARTTSWCSATTASRTSASGRAACSRTRARPRRTSTARPPSPATPPKSADATATPVWRQVSTGHHRAAGTTTARTSWAATTRRRCSATPTTRRVVDHWTVPMLRTAARPSPRAASWSGCRRRRRGRASSARCCSRSWCSRVAGTRGWRTVFAVALGAARRHRDRARDRPLGRVDRVVRHQAGARAPTRSPASPSGCSRSAGCGARARTRRCRWCSSPPIFLFVAGGLADVTTLGHSQVPTHVPGRGSPGSSSRSPSGWAWVWPRGGRVSRLRPAAPARRARAPAAEPRSRPRHQLSSAHPVVVVGLHLDGGVRDLVREQERRAPGRARRAHRRRRRPSRARWRRPSPT